MPGYANLLEAALSNNVFKYFKYHRKYPTHSLTGVTRKNVPHTKILFRIEKVHNIYRRKLVYKKEILKFFVKLVWKDNQIRFNTFWLSMPRGFIQNLCGQYQSQAAFLGVRGNIFHSCLPVIIYQLISCLFLSVVYHFKTNPMKVSNISNKAIQATLRPYAQVWLSDERTHYKKVCQLPHVA